MIYAFWILLGLVVGGLHAWRGRDAHSRAETVAVFLRWWLGLTVGLGALVGAGFHIFDGEDIARQICFTRGDGGFQFENAMGDLAIGVAAFSCLWIRNPMYWGAVVLIFSIQYLGDAYGHIYQMIENDNHCSDNSGAVLWSDIFVPLATIGLYVTMWRFRQTQRD